MLNIIRDSPPPLLYAPLDFDRQEGYPVRFRAYDGTLLQGMFVSSELFKERTNGESALCQIPLNFSHMQSPGIFSRNSRGVIIFCHEYASDMYSYGRYCKSLLNAGYDIFTFDFRSHGKSSSLPGYESRLWCTDKEEYDVLGALYLVQSKLQNASLKLDIGLFGISRGAGAAILAAFHARTRIPVKAVLSDGLFSTDITLESMMKKWVHIFARVRFVYENHRPVFWHFLRWLLLKFARSRFHCRFPSVRKKIMQLKELPIFMIHGEKDSYIKSEQAQMLYDIMPLPRYLWIVPEAKHNQSVIVDPGRYAERTVAFFGKFLHSQLPSDTIQSSPDEQETCGFFKQGENCSYVTVSRGAEANVGKKVAKTNKHSRRLVRSQEQPEQAASIREKTRPLP
jgi:alpha-beta hydrolase superfamily lysophospholipase